MIYTIFDLQSTWWVTGNTLRKRIIYHVHTKKLFRLRNWLYRTTDSELVSERGRLIIANKSLSPSYLSFETALMYHGIISQYTSTVTLAHHRARHIQIDLIDQSPIIIQSHRLPQEMLYNPLGMEFTHEFTIAGPERAIADTLHRSPHTYFDNIEDLDPLLLQRLADEYLTESPRARAAIHTLLNHANEYSSLV